MTETSDITLSEGFSEKLCTEEDKVSETEEIYIPVAEEEDEIDEATTLLTASMIEEEEKLHEENLQESDEEERNTEPETVQVSAEERFKRLTLLLQKSKVYADFLLKVVEEKQEKEIRRGLKREKMQKKKMENKLKQNISKKSTESINNQYGTSVKRKASDDTTESRKQNKKVRKIVDIFKKSPNASKKEEENKLLHTNLYFPSQEDIVSFVSEVDGVRYFGDQVVNTVQPSLFTGGVLRDYQITGYQWLKVLFDNAVNGILADEMGLGKTIQCISLICRLVKVGFKGPYLVCAPMSTIPNWINEFKTFAPSIPLLLYHGSAKERGVLARHIKGVGKIIPTHPVVITSYEIVMRDRMVLARHNWEYLIVDEGHRLKNSNCRLVKDLKTLRANAKLILTGTPLQNNLSELWSLLNFIIPEVFDDLQVFEAWFNISDKKSKGSLELSLQQEELFLSTLYEILTPFVLRRVKADVALDLPPKSEMIVYAPLVPKQESFYRAAVNKTIWNILGDEKQNNVLPEPLKDTSNTLYSTRSTTVEARLQKCRDENVSNYDNVDVNVSLNNIMMLLRKCCNHPYLLEYPLIPGTDYFQIDNDLVLASGKLMLLDRMLPKLQNGGHKVLIFSQMTKMLDILGDYCNLRKYTTVRLDGTTKVEERQSRIKEYNSNPELFIFLLSTRAGGLGINLTAADTVIIYDSDWNPQNDLQAQDRCHRIGQTRPVMIYRLVTASSVDQQMVERAAQKRKLEKMVMHEQKFKGDLVVELKQKTRIARKEIIEMLQSPDYDSVATSMESVMSDEELEKILDRSALTRPCK